jgi:hypothetical protein
MASGNLTFNVSANTSSIPQAIIAAHKNAQGYLNKNQIKTHLT